MKEENQGRMRSYKAREGETFKEDGVFHFTVSSTTERSSKIRAEKLPLDLAIKR